ncbi:hypothetical protein L198_05761 [Cryptococcus wingfieldii CBS 7118]|uniref:Methyltransferase type 11 domain-containing protein n=1 Tax=Cryptococcus wingfieldii CBS 7118 TaxID=1295528 RepID=A0A1E3IU18_9TREE|nr:hypothetical protein L198_05761 [Cryptococcus wingfieldii CBS 7118]ODN92089.1 hypothetical protein L198_05761 [Cryptococcus wingfieldii CBS 7118]
MTSFAKASFDVATYLHCRPSYPQRVYSLILAYHSAIRSSPQWGTLLDLGCGPGFVASELAPRFDQTIALDPSATMVSIGLQPVGNDKDGSKPIQYKVGKGENLEAAGIQENSVDLVVAGQAAHWFDHTRVWPQLTRTVRPGGSVVYLGYAEMQFPGHPNVTSIFSNFSSSVIGKYWSQPGRSIVENLLDDVPWPTTPTPVSANIQQTIAKDGLAASQADHGGWDISTAIRIRHSPESPFLMEQSWSLAQLEGYLRTFSAVHEYFAANPEDKAKRIGKGQEDGKGSPSGDVVERVVWELGQELEKAGVLKNGKGKIEVVWPLVLMMIKKESAV